MSDTNQLSLLDINKYIQKNDLKEVKNANIFAIGKKHFDEEGLWSETIFGRIGSRERRMTFGFIELGKTLINPVVYKLLYNSSEAIRDILSEKRHFMLTNEGIFKEDEIGRTGILFLSEVFRKVNFESNAKKDKKDVGQFLNKNKELIFINRYLILPAGGIRDMSLDAKDNVKRSAEINDIYEKMIVLNNQLKTYSDDLEMSSIFAIQLQKVLNQAYLWVQNRMEGKGGLLRGTMMQKRLDYSARIVATSSPEIKLGQIGLPWHTILTLYEPFFFHWVLKQDKDTGELIKQYLNLPKDYQLGYHDLKNFSFNVTKHPESIKEPLKSKLFKIAGEVTKDKDILIKRDPVVARTSYYSATPIPVDGQAAVVNALTCEPLALDFDGDCIALMPVFTKEGLEEAAKLNPSKSKTVWNNPTNFDGMVYKLTHDMISTIYAATRE